MYVPGVHNFALKQIQRSRCHGNSAESQKLKKARFYVGSTKKLNDRTIVERYFEDEKYQMGMHEQGYSHSDKK